MWFDPYLDDALLNQEMHLFFLIEEPPTIDLFSMGLFKAAHGRGGGKKSPSLKSVTYILQ